MSTVACYDQDDPGAFLFPGKGWAALTAETITQLQWVLSAAGGVAAAGAAVFAWLLNRSDKQRGLDAAAAKEALNAAKADAAAEVLRVQKAAEDKAKERADLAASFQGVNDKLLTIGTAIHEFREEVNGEIGKVRAAAEALSSQVQRLEKRVADEESINDANRRKLDALVTGLRASGFVISFDPSSSTGLVAVPKAKP